jgi:GNAT superfamily N-acetyltransferase
MEYRLLSREENNLLKEIDRGEIIERIYRYRDGKLVLEDVYIDVKGWHPMEVREYIEALNDIHDRGGIIYGAFDGEAICGIGALDSKFFGSESNYLKLDKLYISRGYRGKGIGRKLVEILGSKAKEMEAEKLYISATPFENTVRFYLGTGCVPAEEYIEELWNMEPEDIHLELRLKNNHL